MTAEGESLADLLDMYMKNCAKDRCIKPFGGALFQNYTYAWTPQGEANAAAMLVLSLETVS